MQFLQKHLKPKVAPIALPAALQSLLDQGSAIGKTGKNFENLASASSISNLLLIKKLLNAEQPKRTIEVGLAFAASAMVFADYHRGKSPIGTAEHTAIDPFQSTIWDSVGRSLLTEGGFQSHVRIIEKPSAIALAHLENEGESFDFAYIDGSHLFEDVITDFYYLARLIKLGGLIAFDDSTDHHIAKVLTFIERNFCEHFELLSLAQFYEPTLTNRLKYNLAHKTSRLQLRVYRKIGTGRRAWNAPLHRF